MNIRRFIRVLLTLGAALVSTAALAAPVVKNAWIPEQPPGAMANAVFMVIDNPGDQMVALDKVNAPGFKEVQMHKSVEVNGMHKMIEQKQIDVPAHGHTTLAPGGYHIMLIGPSKRLTAGETLPVTLHFSDGSQQTIDVPVRKREGMMGGMNH